jgi:hypothetical protein
VDSLRQWIYRSGRGSLERKRVGKAQPQAKRARGKYRRARRDSRSGSGRCRRMGSPARARLRGVERETESQGTLLPKGENIRRKRRTIERGKPERLLWSDESARAIVASKFLGGR